MPSSSGVSACDAVEKIDPDGSFDDVTDPVPAFHEAGPEQPLHDRILQAGPASRIPGRAARPVDQPVRIEGVGLARHPAEIEVKAGRRPGLPDCGIDMLGPFVAAELCGQIGFPVHAFGRHVRIELKLPVDDEDIGTPWIRHLPGHQVFLPDALDIFVAVEVGPGFGGIQTGVGGEVDSDFPGHGPGRGHGPIGAGRGLVHPTIGPARAKSKAGHL